MPDNWQYALVGARKGPGCVAHSLHTHGIPLIRAVPGHPIIRNDASHIVSHRILDIDDEQRYVVFGLVVYAAEPLLCVHDCGD